MRSGRSRLPHLATTLLVVAIVAGAMASRPDRSAAIGQQLALPFATGHTWYICQGYRGFSHTQNYPLDVGWTPQSCNSNNNDSGGKGIVSPGDGVISAMPSTVPGDDYMCVQFADGAFVLTHVKPNSGIGIGTNVNSGQPVASVRTATDPEAQNNGIAHLHIELYAGANCYTGSALPFSGDNRMACAPDLYYDEPNTDWGSPQTPLTQCAASDGFTDDMVMIRHSTDDTLRAYRLTGSASSATFDTASTANSYNPAPVEDHMVVGDFDNDGRLDDVAMAAPGGLGTQVRVWYDGLTNGADYAGIWANINSAFSFDGRIAVANLDGDGFTDDIVMIRHSPDDTLRAYRLTGSASTQTFGIANTVHTYNPAPVGDHMVVGDFDNDGRLDDVAMAAPGGLGTQVRVWSNGMTSYPSDYAGIWANISSNFYFDGRIAIANLQ